MRHCLSTRSKVCVRAREKNKMYSLRRLCIASERRFRYPAVSRMPAPMTNMECSSRGYGFEKYSGQPGALRCCRSQRPCPTKESRCFRRAYVRLLDPLASWFEGLSHVVPDPRFRSGSPTTPYPVGLSSLHSCPPPVFADCVAPLGAPIYRFLGAEDQGINGEGQHAPKTVRASWQGFSFATIFVEVCTCCAPWFTRTQNTLPYSVACTCVFDGS